MNGKTFQYSHSLKPVISCREIGFEIVVTNHAVFLDEDEDDKNDAVGLFAAP